MTFEREDALLMEALDYSGLGFSSPPSFNGRLAWEIECIELPHLEIMLVNDYSTVEWPTKLVLSIIDKMTREHTVYNVGNRADACDVVERILCVLGSMCT